MENHLPTNIMVPAGQVPQRASGLDYLEDQEQHYRFRNYWNTIRKRKWLVLGIFLGSMFLAGLYNYLQIPIYKSTTTLQIIQDNTSTLVSEKDPMSFLGAYTMDRFYETQFYILKSPAMAKQIIDSLNLKQHPSYAFLMKGDGNIPKKNWNGIWWTISWETWR